MSSMTTHRHDDYIRDGFLGPVTVVSPEDARLVLQEVLEEDRRNPLSESNNRFKLHLFLPRVAEIAFHPTLITVVRKALYARQIKDSSLSSDENEDDLPVLLWSSDINIKTSNSSGFFACHQDSTYAGLDPAEDCLTAWVALSDYVGVKQGCLAFYPGSHHSGQIKHVEAKASLPNNGVGNADNNNMLSLGQYIPTNTLHDTLNLEGTNPTPEPMTLHAGQATLHSFRCVHASGPNGSDSTRVGLALRYMAGHVRQSKPVRELVTWISGTIPGNRHPTFDWEPVLPVVYGEDCNGEDLEQGRRTRQDAMRREETNYFSKS